VASQGHTIDEALATLAEAVELYLEEVDDPADHITVKPLPDRNRIERKPGGCESPGSVGGGCQLRRPGLAECAGAGEDRRSLESGLGPDSRGRAAGGLAACRVFPQGGDRHRRRPPRRRVARTSTTRPPSARSTAPAPRTPTSTAP